MTVIPNPPTLGDTFLNEVTGVTYEYDGEKWIVIHTAKADAINLEYVLNNGAVADKGILLTDAEDALIALAPEEALIDIASDTSKKNPRIRLTHIDTANYPDSQAQIELDQDGTRVDFEFDQAINDVHFRFDDEEKFVLNKDGDAQFIGKVEGEPGTQNNEFVTYGQLTTLEEEIEQLAPSLERGSWTFTLNHPPGPGEYTMIQAFLDEDDQEVLCDQEYAECLAAAAGDVEAVNACNRTWGSCKDSILGSRIITTDDWTECEQLVFNSVDSKGVTHEWNGIDSDHYIDVFNEADESFMVGDITTHGGGTFAFDLVSSRGTANGLASVKIFKTEGTVDFDQYLRKAGDTMGGMLQLLPNSATPPLYVYPHKDAGDNIYCIRQFSAPRTNPETGTTARETVFYTTTSGDISGSDNYRPSKNRHLTNVQYVQDQMSKLYYPARYSWRVQTKTTAGPSAGYVQFDNTSMSNSSEVRINFKSYDGKLDLFDVGDGKVVYMGASGSSMMLTGYYIGNDTDNKWKWKGTANIKKITILNRNGSYFKCELGPYQTSNQTFSDGNRYYFTISGLF